MTRRLTWVDDAGVRHRVCNFGLVCEAPMLRARFMNDETFGTGVDEGDDVVTCIACEAGDANAGEDELSETLKKSLEALKQRARRS